MYGQDVLRGSSNGSFEISHEISYPYICFWFQQSKISEGGDVLKYHFFLAGYITTNANASTLITVSLLQQ